MEQGPSACELLEESRRVRQVQFLVAFTSNVIIQGNLTRSEAETLVSAARARILDLFPGREDTFEILYARRFARLLETWTTPDTPGAGGAKILPYRKRG